MKTEWKEMIDLAAKNKCSIDIYFDAEFGHQIDVVVPAELMLEAGFSSKDHIVFEDAMKETIEFLRTIPLSICI